MKNKIEETDEYIRQFNIENEKAHWRNEVTGIPHKFMSE